MAVLVVTTHKCNTQTHDEQVRNLIGVTATTVKISTAKNTVSNNLTVTNVNVSGSHNGTIKTFSYSYDGVIHTDSYISDL